MSSQAPNQLRRWLEAEREDSPEAEVALAALFTSLPAAAPSSQFALHVLARVREEAAVLRPGVRRRALSGLLSAIGLLICLSVLPWLLGPAVAALAGGPSLITWLAAGVTNASQWLVTLMTSLDRLLDFAQGFAASAARTPAVALGVFLALGLASLAFWLLERTLARERMVTHAGL